MSDPVLIGPVGPDPVFVLVATVVVLGIVGSIATAVYRAVRMANRGRNPLTLREDLAYWASRAPVLTPAATKAERLDELDVLLGSGRITAEEHAAARARILAE